MKCGTCEHKEKFYSWPVVVINMSVWQWVKGGQSPPRKKQKQSLEERREVSQRYEKENRCRKWSEKWKVDENGVKRDWLVFDGEMHCKICHQCATKDVHKRGAFVQQTSKFKRNTLKTMKNLQAMECSAGLLQLNM